MMETDIFRWVIYWAIFPPTTSNIFSGIGFGRYENFNLFSTANASFTKLWDDPKSSNARNSRSRLRTEVEVRERKNELGDSEVVCRAMELVLLVCGQPIRSTGHDGMPSR